VIDIFDAHDFVQANSHKRLKIEPHGEQFDLFTSQTEQCYKVTGPQGSILLTYSQVKHLGLLGLIERSNQASLFDC
jgi:hypothetical protein